jgi:UDP-N-acetylmuramyl pentapeptide synthase
MKKIIRYIVVTILVLLSKAVVRRYRPQIVMVTGSVGKTSTKDAVASVLATRFYVRKSEKSFNSEFGVPFTILGAENPWNNPFAWVSLVKRALALLILPNHYPTLLVLEVGADKPGDLARILQIATPDVVVVTHLPEVPVHVEAYTSPDAVREEEFSPAYALPASAPLIVCTDDIYAMEGARRTQAHIVTYGTAKDAVVHIGAIDFATLDGRVVGMKTEVTMGIEKKTLTVKGSVGNTQIGPPAGALAVATVFDIPLTEALVALEGYVPPPGRGRLFAGRNGSVIIDDSYNASPVAVACALTTLKTFPNALRRIAVLGDMLELGRYSVEEHQHIGALARESADLVVAIGVRSRVFASVEGRAEVVLFDTAQSAGCALSSMVQPGDVVLVKGSQSIRTERIVMALLAHPSDATLLVRQEKKWGEKK